MRRDVPVNPPSGKTNENRATGATGADGLNVHAVVPTIAAVITAAAVAGATQRHRFCEETTVGGADTVLVASSFRSTNSAVEMSETRCRLSFTRQRCSSTRAAGGMSDGSN